jgi:hypothetical protein
VFSAGADGQLLVFAVKEIMPQLNHSRPSQKDDKAGGKDSQSQMDSSDHPKIEDSLA